MGGERGKEKKSSSRGKVLIRKGKRYEPAIEASAVKLYDKQTPKERKGEKGKFVQGGRTSIEKERKSPVHRRRARTDRWSEQGLKRPRGVI